MTGGGGPKADLLKKMIAEEGLQGRVEMVGAVPHEKARDLLVTPPLSPPRFWLPNHAVAANTFAEKHMAFCC